jgi:nitrate reductase gamma subunit
MAVIYALRIRWLLKFPAGKERQGETGPQDTNQKKGIIYSWANIAMPWAMESTRKKFFLYFQFVVFHMGVVAAIGLTFIIPFATSWLSLPLVVKIFQIMTGAAFIVGIMRMIRRIFYKRMQMISSPDDYFSLLLLTVWFLFTTLSVDVLHQSHEWVVLTYFYMTAFFLLYVPFSKISHYLYYPFTRYYFGKTMGYRGIYPMKKSIKPEMLNRI